MVKLGIWVSCFGLSLSFQSMANTPEKLESRLKTLQGTSTISAKFHNEVENIRGEGEDQRIRTGKASLNLKDQGKGLEVIYPGEMLQQIELEQVAKMQDEEVNTPTLMALGNLDAMDFKGMISASNGILRLITKSEFVSATQLEDTTRATTVLRYKLPLEAIIDDKTTREYVNKFEGFFDIHVNETGTPGYSKMYFKGKGRAYVVMGVTAWLERETHYQLSGDRLLQIERKGKGGFSTSFFPDTSWSATESLEAISAQELIATTAL